MQTLRAQWVLSNGITWGYVKVMIVYGPDLFVGDERGVSKSSDNGRTWTSVNNDLPPASYVHSIAGNGDRLFVGTSQGLFISTDAGGHWLTPETRIGTTVWSILVSGAEVLAFTNSGVYKSKDDGTTWSVINRAIFGAVTSAAVIYDDILVCAEGSAFISRDNGWSWSSINLGLTTNRVTSVVVVDSSFYCSASSDIFRLSADYHHWYRVSELAGGAVQCLLADYSGLYAATSKGIFRSTTGGESFSNVSAGISDPNSIKHLVSNGDFLFTYSTDRNFYRTSRQEPSWVRANTTLPAAEIYALTTMGDIIFVGTQKGVYNSMDTGQTWSPLNNDLGSRMVIAIDAIGSLLFTGDPTGGIYRSENGGLTWTMVHNNFQGIGAIAKFTADGTNILLAASNGVFISADQGTTWSSAGETLHNKGVRAIVHNGSDVLASTSDGIYRSSDHCITWSKLAFGFPWNQYVLALVATDEGVLARTNSGIFSLQMNTSQWMHVPNEIPTSPSYGALAARGRYVFCSTASGIYQSTDFGKTWTDITKNLGPNIQSHLIEFSGSNVFTNYRDTHLARLRIPELATSVEERSAANLPPLTLRAFPNPFTDNTTIEFTLEHSTFVALNIVNVTGEILATLLSEHRDAGSHSVQFDARGLAGGMYYVQMQSGEETRTHSLMLTK